MSHNRGKSMVTQWLRDRTDYQGDECLIWPFSRVRGYGNLKYKDKITYAHIVMCEMVHGPAPTSIHQAAHSCGHGHMGCVHPRHLSWKTPSENELDKRLHGTSRAHTSDGRRYKLTNEQVRAIREMKGVKTQGELATLFNVNRQNIGMILRGKTWVTERKIGMSRSAVSRRAREARLAAGLLPLRIRRKSNASESAR